jgi:peptidoglycan/xylan/chitin deacetylase (PgdA/CDA1 family)
MTPVTRLGAARSRLDGRSGPTWVLMYHSVAEVDVDPRRVTVGPDRFTGQLRWLAERGLRGVGMTALLDRIEAVGHAEGLVGLTFDDGYADFATTAVPILAGFGFTATVYVLAGRLGEVNDWDRPAPEKPLMTAAEVRRVAAAGMEIGSHGLVHRPLPELSDRELVAEVTASREVLAEVTGRPVTGFAYPYGRADPREVRAVIGAGYRHACGVGRPRADTRSISPFHTVARSHVGAADSGLRMAAKRVRHQVLWRRPR